MRCNAKGRRASPGRHRLDRTGRDSYWTLPGGLPSLATPALDNFSVLPRPSSSSPNGYKTQVFPGSWVFIVVNFSKLSLTIHHQKAILPQPCLLSSPPLLMSRASRRQSPGRPTLCALSRRSVVSSSVMTPVTSMVSTVPRPSSPRSKVLEPTLCQVLTSL